MADLLGTVITIDNFATEMSQFSPDRTANQLYGLVDMGSNGIRFSISDLSPPRSRLLHCVYAERAGISLYDALHESSPGSKPFHFSQDIITKVAGTLARFKNICDSYGVPRGHVSVFATEAMRTAENRNEMLNAIKKASNLTVDILSPTMESLFGAMGARTGFANVDGIFMDLGGGSVQMTYVDSNTDEDYAVLAAVVAKSMPFGAAKLSAALSTKTTADESKLVLNQSMKEAYQGLVSKFPKLKEQMENDGATIYFCGGGFRGYGSMLMHTDPIQPYPIPAIGGYTVPGHRFIKWADMLHTNNTDEGKIFGMSKRRRNQFPAIVTVVESLIEAIPKIKQVVFCSAGNREGVLYMKLPKAVQTEDPLNLLAGSSSSQDTNILINVTTFIISALPQGYPEIFSHQILSYIARNIWQNMGDGDSANSTKAIHNPISGNLAVSPGLTHETRAILALAMCARSGTDLGPTDKKLHDNLQALIGEELSWWCQYIGTLARFLSEILPIFPHDSSWIDQMTIMCRTTSGLGKKGHKVGIRLKITLAENLLKGLSVGDLEDMFTKVGKGLKPAWKVEAEIVQ